MNISINEDSSNKNFNALNIICYLRSEKIMWMLIKINEDMKILQ